MKKPYEATKGGKYVGKLCKGWEVRQFLTKEKTSRGNERRHVG